MTTDSIPLRHPLSLPPVAAAAPPPAPPSSSSSCLQTPSCFSAGESVGGACRRFFPVRWPGLRVTSEFDSDSSLFFHKVSCKIFDSFAQLKLKLSFQNDRSGRIEFPQLAFLTKPFSVLYDFDSHNALLKASFDLAKFLYVRAAHDVKVGELHNIHICLSTEPASISCTCENGKSVISKINFGSWLLFKFHSRKDQRGEGTLIATLGDPSYRLELSSSFPSVELPKAKLQFPNGEVLFQEKKEEEAQKRLCISGFLKLHMLDGISIASYSESALDLRYCYKDQEMSFIPSLSLPSNVLSFTFKRRFSPSDKLSYRYCFDSCNWTAVYKHILHKDYKFRAGYDSGMRLGWASLWVGDEHGKAKTAPMKMKLQFRVQVPQDRVGEPAFMFRVKKRWDF